MREKVTRTDNAEASAKKAAEEKRVTAHLDDKDDRIGIGKGVANAGVGGNRMIGPAERMAPYDCRKASDESENAAEETTDGTKKAGASHKNTWIKGSSESKKMGGSHNVKAKL